jgi:hypothetical protein
MHRIAAVSLALLVLASTAAFAQQQVRFSGVHQDELGDLPAGMRVGVFVAERGRVAEEEVASFPTIAGTFDFTLAAAPPEANLRPLVSGSFPLAFMIGNEFVVDREGVRFATAVLHPYHDTCGTAAFDALRDVRYGTTIPALPDGGGFFNLVYVSGPIALRATAAEFALQAGWNLVLSRFEGGRVVYGLADELDLTITTTGPNVLSADLLPCP